MQIIDFKFSSITPRHLNEDYKIVFKWYVLNKIPIMKISITKTKMEKFKIKEKLKNIDLEKLQEQGKLKLKELKVFKNLNMQIKKINLYLELGTENSALTSIIVPVLSTLIAFLIRKNVRKFDDHFFLIKPIYINQNLLNISISGIFEFKINHIINIIYVLNKKEGVNKYERTSNRGTYGYSYE